MVDGGEARGLLHPFLLLLICEQPGHGYELIDRLGCLGVSGVEPGHAYRVLRSLERERLVTSTWVTSDTGPARRRYELTRQGHADLEAWMTRLARLREVLDSCLLRWSRAAQAPPGSPNGRYGSYTVS
ncbi:PadR family transcriptional regulator [Actinomadura sp. NBRC 104425]|nr:PadR family transcriptional regulator [Actinomadura sp. NBRC 104425]